MLHPIEDAISAQSDTSFELLVVESADRVPNAIGSAEYEYVVILGANCIPKTHFIETHRKKATTGIASISNRIFLDQTISQHILDNNLHPEAWKVFDMLKLRVSGHIPAMFPRTKTDLNSNYASFGIYGEEFPSNRHQKRMPSAGTVLQLANPCS